MCLQNTRLEKTVLYIRHLLKLYKTPQGRER